MSTTLVVSRTVKDTGSDQPYEFIVPDLEQLTNSVIVQGDEIIIPINLRDQLVTFWEAGGRNPKTLISTATVIATEEDGVPDAILFNKLSRSPNGKHALVGLHAGYRLYVGKVSMRNTLAPKVKIIRLIFQELSEEHTVETTQRPTYFGKFVVDEMFTSYQEMTGCKPAERLLDKLLATDVVRPYYVNGWSVSNINGIRDRDKLVDSYMRIMSEMVTTDHLVDADEFIDAVEESLTVLQNPKLSAAFQWVDFGANLVGVKPLTGMSLADIEGTLGEAQVTRAFTIDIGTLMGCYNANIIFDSNDLKLLELALSRDCTEDRRYAIQLEARIYGLLRGWRG